MNYESYQDYRMFVVHGDHKEGATVVIIDDYVPNVVAGDTKFGDAAFIKSTQDALLGSQLVSTIILCTIEFEPMWIEQITDVNECLYLVDTLIGSNSGTFHGHKTIKSLIDIGIQHNQIALFTKASKSQIDNKLGEKHGLVHIPKMVGRNNDTIGDPSFVIDHIFRFVSSNCHNPYMKAYGCWKEIKNKLSNWHPRGENMPLFPLGLDEVNFGHNASWWIKHGSSPEQAESLSLGRDLFDKFFNLDNKESSCLVLSHIAVFCGLKAVSIGRLNARLLCEAAGIDRIQLSNNYIDRQLIEIKNEVIIAQGLYALRLFSLGPSSTQPWHFEASIDQYQTQMTILGWIKFMLAKDAEAAAIALSESHEERMKKNPGRESLGTAVTAINALRKIAKNGIVDIKADDIKLIMIITFELDGYLA